MEKLEGKSYQENKIVIFDWGGIVESHKEGEYNCNQVTINIIKHFHLKWRKENQIQEYMKWYRTNAE